MNSNMILNERCLSMERTAEKETCGQGALLNDEHF